MMREQLMAIRAQAVATVAMVDGILRALDDEPVAHITAPGCIHPTEQRIAAGRMGAPNAWTCGVCGEEGGIS